MRIDCPASKRSSVRASEVSTATRSRTTFSTIVWENASVLSGPTFPLWRARVATRRPESSRSTTIARSAGRKSKRRSTTFERIWPTSGASMSVRATWTRISKIFSRAFSGAKRRLASVPESSVTPDVTPEVTPEFTPVASRLKSRLKSSIERTNVEVESLIDFVRVLFVVGCSRT